MTAHECRHGSVLISSDKSRLHLGVVHDFLSRSYWATGIPKEIVAQAIEHSICFGAFEGDEQVGFARVISDRATYAYISDVFVLQSHRGRGIGKRLMECIMSHPELQGLRRWDLFTRDAHGLYRQYGFREPQHPERHMEVLRENPYAPLT